MQILLDVLSMKRFLAKSSTKPLSKSLILTQQQMKIYSQHVYQKCYSHAATAIKYTATTTVNTCNNWNAYYDTVLKIFTLLSYLQKSKQTKVFWCRSNILKSLEQIWSEHIKPAHSTHFHHPKN